MIRKFRMVLLLVMCVLSASAFAAEFSEGTGRDINPPVPGQLFISNWQVLGTLPIEAVTNEKKLPASWSEDIFPISDIKDLSTGLKEKEWEKASAGKDGIVLLENIFPNSTNVAAYAGVYLFSDKYCEKKLLVGSDDGITVWVNNQRVFNNQISRAAIHDSDSFPIKLKKGRNILVMRINQGARGWAFCARLSDNTGVSAGLTNDASSAVKLTDTDTLYATPNLISGPYVQNVTTTSAAIMWYTGMPSKGDVTVTNGSESWKYSTTNARFVSEVKVSDLKPDTTYNYSVTVKNSLGRDVRTVARDTLKFRTFPVSSRPIKILVYGDSYEDDQVHTQLVQAMVKENADLVLHCGDMVGMGDELRYWPKNFFNPAAPMLGSVPYYTTLGNHEGNSPNYFTFFSLPGNERYYSFDLLNIHIISLDGGIDIAEGSAQYKWLVDDLEKNKNKMWKFVFRHHPIYSTGGHAALGSDGLPKEGAVRNGQRIFPVLAKQYGITAFFSGHDHFYEMGVRDGIRYVVTGGGGQDIDSENKPAQNPYLQKHYAGNHYCIIRIEDNNISFTAKNIRGETIDQFAWARF